MTTDLAERVGTGIAWLSEHDQEGRFWMWWQARIDPWGKLPGQDEETIEAYRAYCKQVERWIALDRALAKEEGRVWSPYR